MIVEIASIGASEKVVESLNGEEFAESVITRVMGRALGVQNVLARPAEYYVQPVVKCPVAVKGLTGVSVRLTGVSRDGRPTHMFHSALRELSIIVVGTVRKALIAREICQIFCVVVLDDMVETPPGSSKYSSNLEGDAFWVDCDGLVRPQEID